MRLRRRAQAIKSLLSCYGVVAPSLDYTLHDVGAEETHPLYVFEGICPLSLPFASQPLDSILTMLEPIRRRPFPHLRTPALWEEFPDQPGRYRHNGNFAQIDPRVFALPSDASARFARLLAEWDLFVVDPATMRILPADRGASGGAHPHAKASFGGEETDYVRRGEWERTPEPPRWKRAASAEAGWLMWNECPPSEHGL